ncbi:MAG: hypothetical protein QM809_10730 [Gordonia sp. (in: high G+C Gram-positive bacteria)]|uniref:hypothetical protein n=1 Tax=Gordonia sp. (in: high G+C Gram-positive bacteria) TaxID=84139 RepID=UPI0039E6526A
MSDTPQTAGESLPLAVFGVPVGGLVQVWTDEPTLWQLTDADGFGELVATGSIARAEIGPGSYREIARFDAATGALTLETLTATEGAENPESVTSRVFTSQAPQEVTGDPWEDLGRTIFRATAAAFSRGELIVVEPGGRESMGDRYCLIAGIHEDGTDRILLETKPAPTGSEVWPPSDDPEGQTIAAPASEEALNGAVSLALDAINRWEIAPWDVALTYVVPAEAFREE